jgi:feruloyl-CoA synthase
MVLTEPPAIDAQELTDKGSVNQKAVLANRATLVEALYAAEPTEATIDIMELGTRELGSKELGK